MVTVHMFFSVNTLSGLCVCTDTSRQIRSDETDGDGYWYISPEEFEVAVSAGKFLEYGEFEGNYYGTKSDAIRKTIRSGKMCILDLNPTVSG